MTTNKYFSSDKQACDFCNINDVSNECVRYEIATNRHFVVIRENGKIVQDFDNHGQPL